MKKTIFMILLSVGMMVPASAKEERLVTFYANDESYGPQYWIDREAKKFYYDSDSKSDATMLMKNYVKKGNKESFDIYLEMDPSTKFGHVELTIDPTLKVVKDKKVQTMKVTDKYSKLDFFVMTDDQEKATMGKSSGSGGSPAGSGSAKDAVKDPKSSLTDKAKDKADGLLKKGKGLFKKKK